MAGINYKKTLVTMAVGLYFMASWLICRMAAPGYLSSGVDRIYYEHGIAEGYFSMRSYLVLYVIALLLYVMLMMREDQMYILIRYPEREDIWKAKILHMVVYILQFTLIHFCVDIILMFCFYPASEIMNSQILTYLMMFFPNVFFYYVFCASAFLMCQVFFTAGVAFLLTVGGTVLVYLVMASGMIPSWNPFFFLSMLSIQMQNGINEADLILSYTNFLSLDIIAIFSWLKRYYNKNDIF